ncbi:MAG: gliding motility-associated C-terminal domain-containing protein [Bacteroidota bacterium]|nr:gliding motility-associated C-terminal domain-containing protein [Bacteroidota bacterium]
MAKIIFIFPFILVHFLTIVSKNAFCSYTPISNYPVNNQIPFGIDTVNFIFHDDFEDKNLSRWKQTSDWEVSASEKISGGFSLKHSAKATSGSSSVFHSAGADLNDFDVEWSFNLKNGNWDPSTSNRFWFYLSADTIRTDLINGWAVGVNISGSSDLLEIWRFKNGKADTLIVQSDLDWNASTLATIKAKRTARGVWMLNYQKSGEALSQEFSGTDPMVFNLRNTGLYFNYTPTRSGQLWIDDISVTRQPSGLFIQKLTLINSHCLSLTFNRPVNPGSLHAGNFKMNDENNLNIPITQVLPSPGYDRSIHITFGKVDGIELVLSVSGVSDFSGKMMKSDTRTFSYSFSPEVGSILINEILFNPFSGGVDFVELVNVSENAIPINRLKLAARNEMQALKQINALTTENRYLKPGQFLTCTKNPAIIAAQYFSHDPESFCFMKSLPSFPDDAGTVVLLNDSLEILDEFSYSAKMHSPFLVDENGVSLERISLKKPTSERSNWASAAASVGFATPGLLNSQAISETEIQDEILPEPKAFSPNGDGYNDQLSINFRLNKPGYIANVRIFDAVGRPVKYLVKNQSLAQEGSWLWNGDSNDGQRLTIGVYIILVEVFDQTGNTKTFKKICTLTDRLE